LTRTENHHKLVRLFIFFQNTITCCTLVMIFYRNKVVKMANFGPKMLFFTIFCLFSVFCLFSGFDFGSKSQPKYNMLCYIWFGIGRMWATIFWTVCCDLQYVSKVIWQKLNRGTWHINWSFSEHYFEQLELFFGKIFT
jgi:hypothetical protein